MLNPLGVPSRMNVGQVLETHLGWAAKGLGLQDRRACWKRSAAVAEMRGFLDQIYNETGGQKEDIDSLNDAEVMELAQEPAERACRWRRRCSTAPPKRRSSSC